MAVLSRTTEPADIPASSSTPGVSIQGRGVLAVACGAHALHDGFTDLLYVLFPIWQAAFGRDYAAVGSLRSLAAGTIAATSVAAGDSRMRPCQAFPLF